VGKSSLVNALIGEKVAIVSPKPQTTRRRLRGVFTTPQEQIIFVDAPGFVGVNPSGLNQFLSDEWDDILLNSDALMVVLSPDEGGLEIVGQMLTLALQSKKPSIFVLNKIDLNMPDRLDRLRDHLKSMDVPTFEISALWETQKLRETLIPALSVLLPTSPGPLHDPDIVSLERTRDLAAEMIREKAFLHLKQELPYQLAVRIIKYEELPKSPIRISAEILVNKENHKAMVIGLGGQMIKRLGTEARHDIEQLVGKKVYLELYVAHRPQWMKRPTFMKELGYVKPV
jgi:GTP-binding protein Era